jgi:hypothetical protein
MHKGYCMNSGWTGISGLPRFTSSALPNRTVTGLYCLRGMTGLYCLRGMTGLYCLRGLTGLYCLRGMRAVALPAKAPTRICDFCAACIRYSSHPALQMPVLFCQASNPPAEGYPLCNLTGSDTCADHETNRAGSTTFTV